MKNTTKWARFGAIAVFSVLITACYKDKGNYDYSEFSQVAIQLGNNGFINPRSTDTLHIDAQLIYRGDTLHASEAGDRFSFEWFSNDTEISKDPVLHFPVRELIGQRPYVKLKLTNLEDDAVYLAGFTVDAIPEYQNGWVVLTKKDGRSILSFIDPETYLVTADFYTNIAEEELGPHAIEVKEHWMAAGGLSNTGNILIIRNDPEGNIELDGITLGPIYKTNNFFLANTLPTDFRPKGEFYMWDFSIMLDDNGYTYVRKHENNAFSQSGVYPNRPTHIPGGVTFERGWSGTFLSGQVLLYDKINGRLYLGSDFGTIFPINYMPGPPIPPGTTLIHDMDKELVYVGPIQQGRFTSSYYLVFRDDAGQHSVQRIQVMDQRFSVQAILQYERPFGQGMATSESVFCQFPRIDNYMFYSGGVDNRNLYLHQQGAGTSMEYLTFDAPIKTLSARQTSVMGHTTHDQLLVGLENGDLYIVGTLAEHINNTENRLIKKIELSQGVPVSTLYKAGFGHTQM